MVFKIMYIGSNPVFFVKGTLLEWYRSHSPETEGAIPSVPPPVKRVLFPSSCFLNNELCFEHKIKYGNTIKYYLNSLWTLPLRLSMHFINFFFLNFFKFSTTKLSCSFFSYYNIFNFVFLKKKDNS